MPTPSENQPTATWIEPATTQKLDLERHRGYLLQARRWLLQATKEATEAGRGSRFGFAMAAADMATAIQEVENSLKVVPVPVAA